MAKLSQEQLDQLAELERLRDAPEEPDDDGQGDDDGGIIVLRGSRADTFMQSLLGPAKKATPAKKAAAGAPADPDADPDADPEGTPDPDPDPPKSNRYFR